MNSMPWVPELNTSPSTYEGASSFGDASPSERLLSSVSSELAGVGMYPNLTQSRRQQPSGTVKVIGTGNSQCSAREDWLRAQISGNSCIKLGCYQPILIVDISQFSILKRRTEILEKTSTYHEHTHSKLSFNETKNENELNKPFGFMQAFEMAGDSKLMTWPGSPTAGSLGLSLSQRDCNFPLPQ
jgi:hypothetical protein